jgi:GNAT superfamily N-acetyltransferase
MSTGLTIRNMTRGEVNDLVEWAALEGWNPGLHDAEVFWAADPEAFIAADLDGELIGGGAITSYGGEFGFMGFFIVRPEYRGRGFGNTLWHARLDRLRARLQAGATIGMDGVFDMQEYYARGGFRFSHRNPRFRLDVPGGWQGSAVDDESFVRLADADLAPVVAYDRRCFPAPRQRFLENWLNQPGSLSLGWQKSGRLAGYGTVRRCREGCKIGPLFADDAEIADRLFNRLAEFAAGGPLFLDAPENNPAATALAKRYAMEEVFGCARMYLGPMPAIEHQRVFGVTTFELG